MYKLHNQGTKLILFVAELDKNQRKCYKSIKILPITEFPTYVVITIPRHYTEYYLLSHNKSLPGNDTTVANQFSD